MANAAALARFAELPVPTTTEESWRFTDLSGFDPGAFAILDHSTAAAQRAPFVELDVSGMALVSETGIEIEQQAPEGVRFEALGEDDPRLYSLVGWDEKFAAHNAAAWRHGLLVHVSAGVVLEKPLYVRIASSVPDSALFWRLLVVAEEQSRFALIEEYTSAEPDLRAYSNAVAELFLGQASKLEYVSLQNLSRETWHFATHHARVERDAELDWVAGGFGSKNGKTRIRERPERPGSDLARDGRVLRRRQTSISTTTPSRSTWPPRRSPTSPSRAPCADRRAPSGAG